MSSPPVRIAFVIPTLDQSGAEKQLALLVSRLPREHYDPLVIALNRGGYYERVLENAQIPVAILKKRWRVDPKTHWQLGRLLREFQPDLVHAWLFAANTHVRLLKKKSTRWKCVVSERCVDTWKAGWQLTLDRKLIGRTDAMVANSQSVADFYAEQGVPRSLLHLIPNGIDCPQDQQAEHAESESGSDATQITQREQDRRRWRLQMGFPENAFVIGYTGRLAAQKRLNTLLWSMHMLKLTDPQTRAVFVGAGPEEGHLRELARKYEVESHIRFVGHQTQVQQIYPLWDAFWLASDFEGQSNSLMEAMASGLPVVASEIPPNRELVQEGVTGFLVPSGDSAAFTRKMRQLIARPEWAQTLGQQAQLWIQQHRSVEQMVQRHQDLYAQLLQSS